MQQRMTFWYLLGYSLSKALAKTFFNYRVIGAENMIEEGPCIIAANHCSFLDPPLVGVACKRAIHYLARKSLLEWPVLGPIFPELNVIPVDQKNADRSALMGAIRVVKNGGAVLIFPEGTRSPDGNLQPAQPGLGMIMAKTCAPVVPVYIRGSFEAFPRRANLPSLTPITVSVGRPLHPRAAQTGDFRDIYARLSQDAVKAVAEAGKDGVNRDQSPPPPPVAGSGAI
jgi:1-acyl-sn-glycerol-3-phosphate acyltransferase